MSNATKLLGGLFRKSSGWIEESLCSRIRRTRTTTNFLKIACISLIWMLSTTGMARASFINNNDGTITDTETNLMWLEDAVHGYYSTWDDCMEWVENHVYAGYDDWRLPTHSGVRGASTEGEMGNLFHSAGIKVWQPEPFLNVSASKYYTSTEDPLAPWNVFSFSFNTGDYYSGGKDNTSDWHGLWLVRDVSAVPIPSAIWLLGSAFIGLVGFRSKLSKEGK